ncbi:MAG: DUF2283 domain-containing protein [Candidatus Micrarchaeota archaeon]
MKVRYAYDPDADAISIAVGTRKSDATMELSEHILVDVSNDWKLVGIEIIDASAEISRLFNRAVGKEEIRHLLCEVREAPADEYLVQFKTQKSGESANLLIPLYRSPITCV